MSLPITSLTTAVCLVLLVLLGLWVAARRIKAKVRFETGGDGELVRRVRAHGNFAEYVPFGLIALGLVEAQGAETRFVWMLAAALVGGRLAHAAGLLAKVHLFRVIGIALTFAMLLAAAWRLWSVAGPKLA
jgi:uncharacterized membrane protein YecN with MAPEG domain